VFLTNVDTPDSYIQKQGHGALVSTPEGEWYYASLCARPWNRPGIHLRPARLVNPRPGNRDPESVLGRRGLAAY
jgi:beta-xylosidase